jgi:hypothetical protein
MIDLSDTTFLIPLRRDSEERRENADIIVRYLLSHFQTGVSVCEESGEKMFDFLERLGCRYRHIPSVSPHFHRTMCLNRLVAHCTTPFFCSCDCDVLAAPEQYLSAVELLRRGADSAVFPYDGRFYDVPPALRPDVRSALSPSVLAEEDCRLLNASSLGGALFWKRDDFIRGGMYNEHFIGWGYEDNELVERFTKLGYRLGRVQGPLFHLSHSRKSVDSFNPLRKTLGYLKHPLLRGNKREFRKIKGMTADELQAYIAEWSWTSPLNGNRGEEAAGRE